MKNLHSKQPLIGLTMDKEAAGNYSKFPWYALRVNYAGCVTDSGGIPVGLPYALDLAESYADKLDGLIVTGGAFDLDPKLYGASDTHDAVVTKVDRTQFEMVLTRAMLARNRPVLGICGGQQLLNVIFGGTLIQHIPDEAPSEINHEQPNPRNESGHAVNVLEGAQLAQIIGSNRLPVNSAHHQAILDVADNLMIGALADDGIVESIEHPGYSFCIGVQWHPEFFISNGDRAILKAFIDASRKF